MVSDENSDFSVIFGREGMIITLQIDNDRLLSVALPKKMKIKEIIKKLKEAIKESEKQTSDLEGST